MIKVLAVDDEPLALQQLSQYISKIPYLELVSCCSSARQALRLLESETVHALFLDINMPGMSGMELARQLQEREAAPLVVFTTAYQEFAVEGFRVDAVDYLLKPFSLDDFKGSAERLKNRLEMMQRADEKLAREADDTIFLKTGYKIVRVKVSEIQYIESMAEYVRIHILSGGRPGTVIVLQTMQGIIDLLPAGQFLRIHRSYIVPTGAIVGLNKTGITLTGDLTLPVGDSYRAAVKEKLGR